MNRWIYWIKMGAQLFCYYALAGILFGIFQSITRDEVSFIAIAKYGLLYYGLPLSSILACMVNMNKSVAMANMVISMGETRKNAIIGINIMNIVCVSLIMAVTLLLCISTDGSLITLFKVLVPLPATYLISVGLGLCINTFNNLNTSVINGVQLLTMMLSIAIIYTAYVTTSISVAGFKSEGSGELLPGATAVCVILGISLYIIGNIRMRRKVMILEANM